MKELFDVWVSLSQEKDAATLQKVLFHFSSHPPHPVLGEMLPKYGALIPFCSGNATAIAGCCCTFSFPLQPSHRTDFRYPLIDYFYGAYYLV